MITENYLSQLCKSYYDFKNVFFNIIEDICKPEGLTVMQALLLFMVHTQKNLSVGEISNHFNITHSNASTMCKRLEQDGFVSRSRSRRDERIVIITATDKCKAVMKRMFERGKPLIDALEDVPDEKLMNIIESLHDSAATLKRVRTK